MSQTMNICYQYRQIGIVSEYVSNISVPYLERGRETDNRKPFSIQ